MSSDIALNFAKSLVIPKLKLFERFNRLSGKSGTTVSKMAAHQWTANHVTVGPQLAEMTMSSTKCGIWSCGTTDHVRYRRITVRELADDVGVSIG